MNHLLWNQLQSPQNCPYAEEQTPLETRPMFPLFTLFPLFSAPICKASFVCLTSHFSPWAIPRCLAWPQKENHIFSNRNLMQSLISPLHFILFNLPPPCLQLFLFFFLPPATPHLFLVKRKLPLKPEVSWKAHLWDLERCSWARIHSAECAVSMLISTRMGWQETHRTAHLTGSAQAPTPWTSNWETWGNSECTPLDSQWRPLLTLSTSSPCPYPMETHHDPTSTKWALRGAHKKMTISCAFSDTDNGEPWES